MRFVLLITLMCNYALLLVVGEEDFYNNHPCQKNKDQNAYNKFKTKHFIADDFDTGSTSAWRSHVKSLKRCGEATQTFIKKSNANLVINICNGSGWNQQGNLCTSYSMIPVFVVKVNISGCKIQKAPEESKQYVTVACDKVRNCCRPVHLQSEQTPQPDRGKVKCSPSSSDHWLKE